MVLAKTRTIPRKDRSDILRSRTAPESGSENWERKKTMTDRTSALGMLTLNHRSDDHCFRVECSWRTARCFARGLGCRTGLSAVTYAQTSKPSNAERLTMRPQPSPMICLEFGCSIRRAMCLERQA